MFSMFIWWALGLLYLLLTLMMVLGVFDTILTNASIRLGFEALGWAGFLFCLFSGITAKDEGEDVVETMTEEEAYKATLKEARREYEETRDRE